MKRFIEQPHISTTTLIWQPSSLGITAGRGIFTTHDIADGVVCCYYRGYAVPITTTLTRLEYSYTLRHGSHNIVGAMVPHRNTPAGVAQLANDGYMPNFTRLDSTLPTTTNIKIIAALMLQYMSRSLEARNIEATPTNRLCYRATRHIKAGEELFLHYGAHYWISQARYDITLHPSIHLALGYTEGAFKLFQERTIDILQENIRKKELDVEGCCMLQELAIWKCIAEQDEKNIDLV